jgi:hypothetical protein
MNIENCEKWFKNKNVNPLTKRKIQTRRATYNKIEKECNEIVAKNKKPKMDVNVAANKIAKLFKPLLHKYSGDITDRINYFKIMKKYLNEYKLVSKNNCLQNYKKNFLRIGKRIIINKKLGEGVYGIVFNAYFRPDIKNKQYGKALKLSVKLSEYTTENETEAEVYKEISKYVIKNKCPHFSIFYDLLVCEDLGFSSDSKEMLTSSLITSNSKKSLNINKNEYDNVDYFKLKQYYLTLTELADGTLYDFLFANSLKKFACDYYKLADNAKNYNIIQEIKQQLKFNCIIQCLISIVFFHKMLKYSHNDAHLNNYLIHKIKPGGYFHYNIYGVDYYLKNMGVLVILNDFGLIENLTAKNVYKDFSYLSNTINNKKIDNFIDNIIIKELYYNNANIKPNKKLLDYFGLTKKPSPPSLKQLEDNVYPNIFKELAKSFPEQLLTTKPNDVIKNKLPYTI